MACHENALEAIFEDGLSDADFEDGEIDGNEQIEIGNLSMDLDADDEHGSGAEEGELVEDSPRVSNRSVDLNNVNGQKKPKRRRSGKKRKSVDIAKFVKEACNRLKETKLPLMWAAVKSLGVEGVTDLLREVDAIENCGGQMTNDGKRRRTPGGVMWNILRDRVGPDVYKNIMSQGNQVQKQKLKEARESLKRNRMDEDEPANNKRQKIIAKDSNNSAPAHKQQRRTIQWSAPVRRLLNVTDGPQRDDSLQPAVNLQQAWAEGIKKKENMEAPTVGTSILPEKKSAPLHERLRIPVEYSDLGKTSTFSSISET